MTASRASPQVFAVNHVVIPAAIIAMVSALLFFLLDVRSVFLTGTEALKWVGFWFVNGTVLIARYGRTSANAERQGCYTVALGGATVVAMSALSARDPSTDFAGLLANLLIILVVWRFATRLTRRLSLEGGLGKAPEPRLYGIERLHLEQWRKGRDEPPREVEEGPERRGRTASSDDAFGNPVIPVARLAAAGLLAFALGEPFLLSGPPAAGERALGAMIIFLLAAAAVLAAGSGLGNLRRVRALGGQASLGMLPGRIAAAGVVMVLLAALALAMPGIEVRGTGQRRPPMLESGASGGESGQFLDDESREEQIGDAREGDELREGEVGEGEIGEGGEEAGTGRHQGEGEDSDGPRSSERPPEAARGLSRVATSLVGHLAELGKWVRYAVIVAALLLALWGLWWLLNHLGHAGRWLGPRLGRFFRALLAGLAGMFRLPDKQHRKPRIDPFANWRALRRLEPREAVIAAYGRLLAAFELLEHPRPERQTPYEFLASIPVRLARFKRPARELTEAYVKLAYSEAPAGDGDRQGALAALEAVRERLRQK